MAVGFRNKIANQRLDKFRSATQDHQIFDYVVIKPG